MAFSKIAAENLGGSALPAIGGGNLTGISAGISQAQQWRINSSFTFSSAQDINTNWEISDSTAYGSLGSNLTQSSGVFTFLSTGYYLIMATFNFRRDAGSRAVAGMIFATTNNTDYVVVSTSETHNSDFGGGSNTTYQSNCDAILDVTDTSNVKFKLRIEAATNDQTCDGDSGKNQTGFMCIRLGDT